MTPTGESHHKTIRTFLSVHFYLLLLVDAFKMIALHVFGV